MFIVCDGFQSWITIYSISLITVSYNKLYLNYYSNFLNTNLDFSVNLLLLNYNKNYEIPKSRINTRQWCVEKNTRTPVRLKILLILPALAEWFCNIEAKNVFLEHVTVLQLTNSKKKALLCKVGKLNR